jgi:hypothetical protein
MIIVSLGRLGLAVVMGLMAQWLDGLDGLTAQWAQQLDRLDVSTGLMA